MKLDGNSTNYKSAADREKSLKLALLRIQKGRAHTKETKVTFASVAREAGVSTALIHNYYPQIAKAIREAQGRSSRTMRDVKHQKLIEERKKSADYRREIEEMRAKIANLASINEVILAENRILNEELSKRKVVAIATRTP
jgi:AcrR family transcriptional regulator